MRSRILWVLVAILPACDAGKLTCKDAILKARTGLDLTDDEVSMMIGTCELRDWSGNTRSCIAAAKTVDAVEACTANVSDHATKLAESLAALHRFSDEMCRCHDTACATRVNDEMTRWSEAEAKHQMRTPKLSDAETKELTAVAEKMGKCMQQAMTTGIEPQVLPPAIEDR